MPDYFFTQGFLRDKAQFFGKLEAIYGAMNRIATAVEKLVDEGGATPLPMPPPSYSSSSYFNCIRCGIEVTLTENPETGEEEWVHIGGDDPNCDDSRITGVVETGRRAE